MNQINDTGVRPVGDKVLLRRDAKKETYKASQIVMLDGYDSWPWTAVVLEVGPQVKDPEIVSGARVLFQPKGSSALTPDNREGGKPEWDRVVQVPEENILGVVEEE